MLAPTKATSADADSPLFQVHAYLKSQDKDFQADLPTFEQDMQDDEVRQQVYDFLKGKDKDFQATFDEFTNDLGVKKKDQQASGSGATPTSLPEPFPSFQQDGAEVAAPVGQPGIGDVPAEVATAPAIGPESVIQPDDPARFPQGFTPPPMDALATGRSAIQQVPGDAAIEAGQPVPSLESLRAANDTQDDGFFATFGRALGNSLNPNKLAGNVVDYLGDTAELAMNTLGSPLPLSAGGATPLRDDKATDLYAKDQLALAKQKEFPISDKAKASILDQPTNAAAWGNLLGQGAGSIIQVGAASLLGGPGAGIAAGSALGVSATKEMARANGISDKEAALTATVLAPIQGVLEELGMGFITKNPVALKLLQAEIIKRALAYGEGKLAKSVLVRAASELMPEVVKKYGSRALTGAAGEAVTEMAQSGVEGEGQILADELRGNPEAANGQGRYGTTQADVRRSMAESGIAAIALGGSAGTLAGGSPQANTNVGQSSATNEAVSPPIVASAPQFEVPADVTPEEQQAAQQAYPQPVQIVRPTGQVMFPNAQVVALSPDGKMARIVGKDGAGNPVDTAVPVEYITEQPTAQADEPSTGNPEVIAEVPTGAVGGTGSGAADGLNPQLAPSDAEPAAGPLVDRAADGASSGENASVIDVTGQDEVIPAEETQPAQEAPAELAPAPVADPKPAKALTPQQQATNDVLDSLAGYNELGTRDRKGKKGNAARAELAAMAEKAGLDLAVDNEFGVTVTRGGKRVTRTNTLTGTTAVEGHVPARDRAPAVRDAALTVAGRVANGSGEFVALGVEVNGKRLNARDAKAAAQDILDGRNTHRADLLLNKLQEVQESGFAEVSTGTGLLTKKERIPAEDFFGNPDTAAIKSKQEVPLSDAEVDALIAEDPQVEQAIADYTRPDGSVDFGKLAEDERALPFLFGVSDDIATKLSTLARERATQTTPAAEAGPDARAEAPSLPQPASPDSGSAGQEVAPKLSLREQNEAAKAELSSALSEFKEARKKKSGVALSSVLGVPSFSAEESAAIQKMVKALIKLGAVNTKRVIAGLRKNGLTEDDATDEQLAPLVKQTLKAQGVFKAKGRAEITTDGTLSAPKKRKSVANLDASPAFSDATKQAVQDAGLADYTPRSQADAVAAVEGYMQRVSLSEAVVLASGPGSTLNGDVQTVLRQQVLKALSDQMRDASDAGNTATAEALYDQVVAVATAYAGEGTAAGQKIAAYALINRYSPEGAVVKSAKDVKEQADTLKADAAKKAGSVARRARKVQQQAVTATLSSPAVAHAKQALAGDPNAKDPAGYGEKNKIFTKERIAEAKKAFRAMGLSSVVPPELILGAGYHIEAGTRKFVDVAAKLVRDFGVAARPYLRDAYNEAVAQFIAQGGNPAGLNSQSEIDDAIAQNQAEMLTARIITAAREQSTAGPANPVEQLLNTLTAKVAETLPKQAGVKLSPKDAIIAALRNEQEYADVWERAKKEVEASIAGSKKLSQSQKDAMTTKLNTFYAETIGQPYATKQATKLVKGAMKDLNTRLDDVVRRHSTEQNATAQTLVQKLVGEAGLTQAEAQAYADVVEKEFKRQVAARRETILERLHTKLGAVLPARKGKTALDKLFETLNLSPVTDQRVTELLQAQLDLPMLTPADVDNLRKLADAVQAAQGERAKAGAIHELLLAQKRIEGMSVGAKIQAWQYANMLSNYMTHVVNFTATGANVAAEAFLAVGNIGVRKPSLALAPLRGLGKGLKLGVSAAYDAVGTGVSLPRAGGKFDMPNDLEAARDKYSAIVKYVPRLLKATDTFWQSGLREMHAYELAVSEALAAGKDRPTAEIWNDVHNKLYGAGNLLSNAEAAARLELPALTGANPAATALREAQYQMRVYELFSTGRDKALREASTTYAAREAFNGELEGSLGAIMTYVGKATDAVDVKGFKPLKLIIPFTGVVTSVVNKGLDWTPYGLVRAVRGDTRLGGSEKRRAFTRTERAKLAAKASTWAMATAASMAYLTAQTLSGAGPDDSEKKKMLQQGGWQPYSLKIGEKWYSYKDSPLYFTLAGVAALKEDEAYNGRGYDNDPEGWAKGAGFTLFATMKATLNATPLKALQDLLATFSDGRNQASPGDAFGRWAKRTFSYNVQNLIPLSGTARSVIRDYESAMNLPKREANTVWQTLVQDVPGAWGQGGIAYDGLGNPLMVDSDRLVSAPQYRDAATIKIHDFLLRNNLSLPALNRNQADLAVIKTMKVSQLSAAEKHEYNRLPDKQRKQWLEKKSKSIGPMSDAEWSAFYQKRGELLKAALLEAMPDRSFGYGIVAPGMETQAADNPRALVKRMERIGSKAKEAALKFVIQDRALHPEAYVPGPEEDDE